MSRRPPKRHNVLAFSVACISLGACLLIAPAFAQPRPLAVVSPEVHADRSVVFRIKSPNAQKIVVAGDFFGIKQFPLTKDDAGVWSATVGPLEADLYVYHFEVDGVDTPDPCNTSTFPGSSSFLSTVDVPGDRAAFIAKRDVPHGEVHEIWYHNTELNAERRMLVYTPPGYNGGADVYPVIYLLHGAGGNEASWINLGRANFIMDNLLADKKAKPAVIVMPFGQSSSSVYAGRGARGARGNGAPGRAGPGAAPAGGPPARGGGVFESDLIQRDINTNIIPLIEREYRVQKDATHRAIMGFSMGGGQTLAIGLPNPQQFSFVAAFSSASSGPNLIAGLAANPQKANQDFKLLYLTCGMNDGLFNGNQQLEAAMTAAGIKHEWTAAPDYAHEWTLWRRNLRDTLEKVFVE